MINEIHSFKPTRIDVVEKLRAQLPGKNLFQLADEVGVWVQVGSKKNKGWVGQTVEKVAGLSTSNEQKKDGSDFELKTTSLIKKEKGFEPKETIKITQLNPNSILEEEFQTSSFWDKLGRLILVTYWYPQPKLALMENIYSVNVVNPELIKPIQRFWEDVKYLVCSGEIRNHINLGTSDDLIQLRPLGDGRQFSICPVTGESFPSRAFYATKKLIKLLMRSEAA